MPKIKPGNKWIVVTSISYPTKDMERLASFDDWNLVVVADTKTPADWKLENVHFLSVDYQNSLDFQIVHYLPYKSYTRKNIGYLYAISNGAEWIYDTDDDNKPYGLGLKQFNYEQEMSGLRYTTSTIQNQSIIEKLFNPYRFFGLDKMWPRGFPLEYIKHHNNGEDRQVLCSKMKRSAVQQGLVHHDPDVDAVYRLLNADQKGLDERFNKFAPSILLEPGTYAPWNSQNTLFHKSAFHILMLPTTVSFRTTDIWRSFFAQKILHLSGLAISFIPVNAVQFRNSHNFLKDFQDERQVYEDSGKIIRYLDNWECGHLDIPNCMRQLAKDFTDNGFWKEDDQFLIDLYIEDLLKINYEFAILDNNTSSYKASANETEFNANCRRAQFEFDLTYPVNSTEPAIIRTEQKIKHFGQISKWCTEAGFNNFTNSFPSAQELAERHSKSYVLKNNLNNVLLIVNNYPWKWGIGHLQRLYQPYFASVVFCGSYYPDTYQKTNQGFAETIKPFNFIHMNPAEIYQGFLGYHCLTLLHEVGFQNVQGYYFMADDAHFNIWQRIDFKRVHHLGGVEFIGSKDWWTYPVYGLAAAERVLDEIENTIDVRKLEAWDKFENGLKTYGYIQPNQTAADDLLNGTSRSISDFFYVPQSEIGYYSVLMRLFFENKLFLELAVNRFLRSVRHQTSKSLNASYLWFDRDHWAEKYSVDMVAMHPIKLSMFRSPGPKRFKYCNVILKSWHDIVFNNSSNYTTKGDNEPDVMNG
ncbi:unnamed protein product [Caenorhabditis angaria]|uniref:Uncharacterized protein n=1 Tax=Caenorhabditis angaria TaxID=860376 RepID=A0A9P1N108_9PELO|nr:unnamed protein product [Caenorhabditis angaria]